MTKKHEEISIFTYVKSVGRSRDLSIYDVDHGEHYDTFMVNRLLSRSPSTVLYAAEMNRYANLPARIQYAYYISSARTPYQSAIGRSGRGRYEADAIAIIQKYYGYNAQRAAEALSLLLPSDIDHMRRFLSNYGGRRYGPEAYSSCRSKIEEA